MKPFSVCIALSLLVALTFAGPVRAADAFVHPGILHTTADLARMRDGVAKGEEPWKSGYAVFAANPLSKADYAMKGPLEVTGRGPGEGAKLHTADAEHDCVAAYQNALMFAITGDAAHAKTARNILLAWAKTLKKIDGRDKILGAGFWSFEFANAAEILRSTDPDWTPDDTARVQGMLKDVFYPVIQDFATFANGNWDGACIKGMMAIGVFCDDRAIFDRAVAYYRHGSGNGCITHYVINDAGQCQESGRDQAHTQLGLGLLAEACEVAWNQHIDLYSLADNRLLKGFEYTARYNLGEDVPFEKHIDTTGKYPQSKISPQSRGAFRSVWELPYNHYHNRLGLPMPWTLRVLEKIRPEGAPFGADNPGFGTLLFSLPPASK